MPLPMKSYVIFLCLLFLFGTKLLFAQSNNPLSVFEGERIQTVHFSYSGLPADSARMVEMMHAVENAFAVYPYTHFNQVMADYYLSRVRNLPFVGAARMEMVPLGEGGIGIEVYVELIPVQSPKTVTRNLFRTPGDFPVVYSNAASFLTFRLAASEMGYSNANAWFARPEPLLAGNPLVDVPAGQGYTGWVEGYGMGGLYGITRLTTRENLHLYGGASYIAAFSAGRELFTDRSRFHGNVEDAFVGLVGGRHYAPDHDYAYNLLYGRKQFVLGNGWLIVNTGMNGEERAALQLNPRVAARRLFQMGARWDKLTVQAFQLRPNELRILNSHTILNGLNAQYDNNNRVQIGGSVLFSPCSGVKYYLPDGTQYSRRGLWVYNLRLFGNPVAGRPGLFYKTEAGYQTNKHFRMRAYAWYVHLGWNFATTCGKPALSYRFAYFSGDNPKTRTYERWDALYTGGNGEQWVQGSNMYKMVQNSNEMTHLLQLVYSPLQKVQTVTQLWAFIAPEKNNLGGNPGLSTLESRYYGSEINFTLKYFPSQRWYFHLNAALTFPGDAIRNAVPSPKDWFCLMAFVRFSM